MEANKNIIIIKCKFRVSGRIPRCSATNLIPDSDISNFNLPLTLRKIYGHIDMGIYLEPLNSGKINVNDEIKIQ